MNSLDTAIEAKITKEKCTYADKYKSIVMPLVSVVCVGIAGLNNSYLEKYKKVDKLLIRHYTC